MIRYRSVGEKEASVVQSSCCIALFTVARASIGYEREHALRDMDSLSFFAWRDFGLLAIICSLTTLKKLWT
jgi:hypothetical protein